MDMDMFRDDLKQAVGVLPVDVREKIGDILNFAFDKRATLMEVFPALMGIMGRYPKVIMIDAMTGGLNVDQLEDVVREVFKSYGIEPKGVADNVTDKTIPPFGGY